MLFDAPDEYYAPQSDAYYSQGDIVLAPRVAVLPGGDDSGDLTPLGAPVSRMLWTGFTGIPDASVSASLVPAMITAHNCTLDKEFNRRYEDLRRTGLSKDAAVHTAATDESLDRTFTVAPIIPASAAAPTGELELMRNRAIGYFPVCRDEDRSVDPGVAQLTWQTTIDRAVIAARLAILSDDARAALIYALARTWAYRAPRLGFELEAAIGKRIKDVALGGPELSLEITLSDGSLLRLLQAPSDPAGGVERPGLSS